MTTIWKTSPSYPPLLNQIYDPPARLFCLGQKLNPKDRYFAVVGTRHPTPYGMQMAEDFSSALASIGFVIVSGLAYGIDGAAHKAALDCGGRTIAVLGAGFNNITPTCNIALAKEIQKNGAVITEYEADFPPQKCTFPKRNRIIAGMSRATLIIEAPEKSGALITARLALEYNRDVFAIPGNITQKTSAGTNRLIRDGCAFPATCVEDIFEAMELLGSRAPNQTENKKGSLTPAEEKIYDLLQKSSLSMDQIVFEAKLPASKVNELLSALELKGLITTMGGYAFVTR